MKKHNLLSYLFFAAIILLSSCKGEDGEVGPAGPQGPQGESYDPDKLWEFKEGSATATATGTRLDGTSYSYNLNYQGNYNATNNYYQVLSGTETQIRVSKVSAGDGDAMVYGEIYFNFEVTSLNDLSSPTLNSIAVEWTKDLGNNTFHRAYYYWSPSIPNGSATLTNLSYNATTGVLTGNFTISMNADSQQGNLSITNGAFSTKLSTIVARMAAQ
ncbi:MAG: hypothetical protein K2X86_06800 [Cytophagaceae bacterium]|nr:hypothetical protein [Cytophagaceae bacterium]